ncbi:hypothetical protein ONZ45_g18816 [Pleurotus djamor]|nr:hypothetical protein ONZ45_g18816 [Pleurotus djamor]
MAPYLHILQAFLVVVGTMAHPTLVPRTSLHLLTMDLEGASATMDRLGQCAQELSPPTVAVASACVTHIDSIGSAFEELTDDLNNTTMTSDEALTFLAALNSTVDHLGTSLNLMVGAVPLFAALDEEDSEEFSLDDVGEELGDTREALDGVFDNLRTALPTTDLKNQAKAIQQIANQDLKAAIKAFEPKEA